MIRLFTDAWTHSRFERTGVDELIMGITPVAIILFIAIARSIAKEIVRQVRHRRTRRLNFRQYQQWSDGKVVFTIMSELDYGPDMNMKVMDVRQSNAPSFTRSYSATQFRELIASRRLYAL